MVNLESYDSPQIKLIQEFDRGFLARDANILAKPLHNNFRHIVYPRSLGVPAANKEEWLRSMNYVLNSPIRFSDVSYTNCYQYHLPWLNNPAVGLPFRRGNSREGHPPRSYPDSPD